MTINDVQKFLTKCKLVLSLSEILTEFSEQDKNTVSYLGYQLDDIKDEVLNLQVCDYIKGPLRDDKGYAKDWWVFGKVIQDREVYIKLKVKDYNLEGEQQLSCFCISFHFAKYTLKFPYKS